MGKDEKATIRPQVISLREEMIRAVQAENKALRAKMGRPRPPIVQFGVQYALTREALTSCENWPPKPEHRNVINLQRAKVLKVVERINKEI